MSLRRNILAGSLGMFWAAAVFGMPLPMLMESLGASGILIGLLTTVRQLAMLAQIPGAFIAEHLTSRRAYWATLTIAHRLVWFLPAFLPLIYPSSPAFLPLLIVATVALSDVLANSSSAAWFSWMSDLVPSKTSGQFWGLRHSWVTGTNLVAMALYGTVLDFFPSPADPGGSFTGFAWVFSLAAIFGTLDIYIHLKVKEPHTVPLDHRNISFQRITAAFESADFRQLTWSAGMWNFAVGLIGAFSAVYLKRSFQASYTQLAIIGICAALGALTSGALIGRLIDRVGARPLMVFSLAAASATSLPWFLLSTESITLFDRFVLPQPVVVAALASIGGGIAYSGVVLCQMRLLTALCPTKGRTMAMAVHLSLVGLLASMGPALGGLIMDWFDAHPMAITLPLGAPLEFFQVLVVLHIVIVTCCAIPLALKIRFQKGDLEVGSVARILLLNPLQAVRNMYNLNIIASPRTPKDKARAVRSMGESRSPLAVRDLIANLDDPSSEVQEQALIALGAVGTDHAVEALLQYFEDPASEHRALAARALGETGDSRAAKALLKTLRSTDRELNMESARALGMLGHDEATPVLMELFRSSTDDKMTASIVSALGHLQKDEALPGFFELLLVTKNPVLKRTLGIAIGDILGEPNGFYRVLVGESRAPGSEMERLCVQMRRTVRRLLAEQAGEKLALQGLEQLIELFENGELYRSAQTLERLYSTIWEGLEARGLSTGRMHLPGSYIRSLATLGPADMRDPNDVLLATYLLVQTCPVHPLAR